MAVFRNMLFVGTRMDNRIYCYSGNGWSYQTLPSGALGELATDGYYLYALIFRSKDPLNSSIVRRYDPSSNNWDMSYTLSGYSIQSIYGAGGTIFAGCQHNSNRSNYALTYIEPSSNLIEVIKFGTSLLKGAALGPAGIYLATMGNGIFLYNRSNVEIFPVAGTSEANIVGITNVGSTVIAVSGNGEVYFETGGSFGRISTDVNYTGALCVWLDRENMFKPSLLLMGIRGKGSSLKHGYHEMVLDNGRPTFEIKSPGDGSPTSVKNKAKYTASIGTHPVMSILQVPDVSDDGPISYSAYVGDPEWEPPIFASTSMGGLWSYRNSEWNAED